MRLSPSLNAMAESTVILMPRLFSAIYWESPWKCRLCRRRSIPDLLRCHLAGQIYHGLLVCWSFLLSIITSPERRRSKRWPLRKRKFKAIYSLSHHLAPDRFRSFFYSAAGSRKRPWRNKERPQRKEITEKMREKRIVEKALSSKADYLLFDSGSGGTGRALTGPIWEK